MRRLRTFWRRLAAPIGIVEARWELVIMRLLFVSVMFDTGTKLLEWSRGEIPAEKLAKVAVIPEVAKFQAQPHPNGVAHLWDLTFLSDPAVAQPIYVGFYVALGLYAAGLLLPLALGYLFVVMLLHGTFHNSQGSIHHHMQTLTLIVGLQWIAVLRASAGALWPSLRWRGGVRWFLAGEEVRPPRGAAAAAREWWRSSHWTLQKMADWTRQAMVASYVVSAVSKFWMSDGLWMWKVPRLGIQLRKAMDQDYYDTLEHSTHGHEWLPEYVVNHPWISRLVFGPALLLEFFFFLALRNRRMSALYAVAVIGFHLGVSSLMSLDFRYNIQLIIIYFINVPFWLWAAWRWGAGASPVAVRLEKAAA